MHAFVLFYYGNGKNFSVSIFRETATLFPILMLYFQLYLQPTHLRPIDEDRKPDKRDSPIQHHQGKDKATPVQSLDQSQ